MLEEDRLFTQLANPPANWARMSPCSDFNESKCQRICSIAPPAMSSSNGDTEEWVEVKGGPQRYCFLVSGLLLLLFIPHFYIFSVKEKKRFEVGSKVDFQCIRGYILHKSNMSELFQSVLEVLCKFDYDTVGAVVLSKAVRKRSLLWLGICKNKLPLC